MAAVLAEGVVNTGKYKSPIWSEGSLHALYLRRNKRIGKEIVRQLRGVTEQWTPEGRAEFLRTFPVHSLPDKLKKRTEPEK